MSTTPITRPLPGERVLEVSPDTPLAAAQTWLRRPNVFAGRALTATTLAARSAWMAGRIVQRGQAYTPGVVQGLELGYELRATGDARADVRLRIAAGRGLAASGEDVVLAQELEADAWSLPVVAPPAVFEGGGFGVGGVLQPREIRSTLGAMLASNPALPRAGVLVLQPVSVHRADLDPEDPCDRCGCAEGKVDYEDWRVADAVRLLWYAWPQDWQPLPARGEAWRNRIAHRVFDAERALAADAVLPWEEFGVPIALVGLDDAAGLPQFADRASVVRRGGLAREARLQLATGTRLMDSARLPALWQAQIEQFAEQLAAEGEASAGALARRFEHLPPCGLLPRDALDLATRRSTFFPARFDLDAVPVPLEQLDLALREAAGLAPLDLSRGERLRVLVPVTQTQYEPRLLLRETLAPEFQQTLDHFLLERARALAARQGLRLKSAVLLRAMRGEAPAVPAIGDDAQALEPEAVEVWGPPAGAGHRASLREGLHAHGFTAAGTPLVALQDDALYAWVCLDPEHAPRSLMLEWRSGGAQRRAYWGENRIELGTEGRNTRLRIGDLPEAGRWVRLEVPAALLELQDRNIEGMGFLLFDGRAAWGAAGRLSEGRERPWFDAAPPAGARADGDEPFESLSASDLLAPFEARHGVVPAPAGAAAPLAADASTTLLELVREPRLTQLLSRAELAQLPARGVEGFMAYLRARADRADDLTDTGFVRVQTDLYRLRQLVLNATDASRLAVSPALASIARADTAVATREDISKFLGALRGAQGQTTSVTSATAAASSTAEADAGVRMLSMRTNLAASALPTFTTETLRVDATRAQDIQTFEASDRVLTDFSAINSTALYTPQDVAQSTPMIGTFNLRTLSIAERLQLPKAQEARDYATSTRHEAVSGLLRLADELVAEDGEVPGLFENLEVWGLAGDFGESPDASTPPRRTLRQFIDPAGRQALLGFLLAPPLRTRYDESTHFSDSTELADRTVALLRQVEGRVARYRAVIALCERALNTLRADLSSVGLRERVWSDALAEARHDVAVTRALIAEEQARIDAVNARRAEVLASEVRFLAFVRQRAADTLARSVARTLDPGLLDAPVPACLGAHADVPDELDAMLAVLREAPAAWFGQGQLALAALDRSDLLIKAVQTAQQRAPRFQMQARAVDTTVDAIGKVRATQWHSVGAVRTAGMALDLSRLGQLNWEGLREQAANLVSLGDLMEGGRGIVAKQAAAFFGRFEQMAGCLHAGFSAVPASIRLDWAQTLSQFDAAPSLRNLASLSRWSELDYADRQRLQGLVDWMFDQVETRDARAPALVNDLVRVCLLLASHAPVGRIVAGRLPRPTLARPGLRIPMIALDPARLRVGMQALVYRADRVVARAVVEDLGAEAAARLLHVDGGELNLAETDRVQFGEATGLSLAAGPRA